MLHFWFGVNVGTQTVNIFTGDTVFQGSMKTRMYIDGSYYYFMEEANGSISVYKVKEGN